MLRPAVVVCVSALFGIVAPSAIPMWEFLKKEEKTSYIYSLFANEVEQYCKTMLEDTSCNQELLKFGLQKLRHMSNEELDELDPYQRDSISLIWDTLMNGHADKKVPAEKSTTTPKPNSYDDDLSFGVTDDFGSQSEESARIETFFSVTPPKGFAFIPIAQTSPSYLMDDDFESQRPGYASNSIQTNPGKPKYFESKTKKPIVPKQSEAQTEPPFENIYPKKVGSQEKVVETLQFSGETPKVTLTGPSVIRVHPDGTPVTEHAPKVPQDEDLYQYRLTQLKLPRF